MMYNDKRKVIYIAGGYELHPDLGTIGCTEPVVQPASGIVPY